MGTRDPRVDAYIERSAEFAKPILLHIRNLVHKNCPQVQETIKWGFPHFDYKGILCSMASFKQHCAFGFWNQMMKDSIEGKKGDAMGQYGRITSIADLPKPSMLAAQIKEAVKLKDAGIKPPSRPRSTEKKGLEVPNYLTAALKKNKNALATFENFSYTNKKEYVDWIIEAKTDETRNKRLSTAVEWMAEGKIRNWKYLRK
jgi:uncharacterized protein YdeI (YjbR/CyaY-like superfamily)